MRAWIREGNERFEFSLLPRPPERSSAAADAAEAFRLNVERLDRALDLAIEDGTIPATERDLLHARLLVLARWLDPPPGFKRSKGRNSAYREEIVPRVRALRDVLRDVLGDAWNSGFKGASIAEQTRCTLEALAAIIERGPNAGETLRAAISAAFVGSQGKPRRPFRSAQSLADTIVARLDGVSVSKVKTL